MLIKRKSKGSPCHLISRLDIALKRQHLHPLLLNPCLMWMLLGLQFGVRVDGVARTPPKIIVSWCKKEVSCLASLPVCCFSIWYFDKCKTIPCTKQSAHPYVQQNLKLSNVCPLFQKITAPLEHKTRLAFFRKVYKGQMPLLCNVPCIWNFDLALKITESSKIWGDGAHIARTGDKNDNPLSQHWRRNGEGNSLFHKMLTL